jgi:DNA-binding transcriptional ArsR family regulator
MGTTKSHLYTKHQNATAEVFKSLGHPARVAILEYLLENGPSIGSDLVKILNLAQPTVSRHLNEMVNSGILEAASTGNAVRYSVDEKNVTELLGYLVRVVKLGTGKK